MSTPESELSPTDRHFTLIEHFTLVDALPDEKVWKIHCKSCLTVLQRLDTFRRDRVPLFSSIYCYEREEVINCPGIKTNSIKNTTD
jgi:hypothetical protein